MAKRLISKLKEMKFKVEADPSIPKGVLHIELHPKDVEVVKLGDEVDYKSEFIGEASKVATAATTLENVITAAAVAASIVENGEEATVEKIKAKLGVSGTDASWSQVVDILDETRLIMEEEKQEIIRLINATSKPADGHSDNDGGTDLDTA